MGGSASFAARAAAQPSGNAFTQPLLSSEKAHSIKRNWPVYTLVCFSGPEVVIFAKKRYTPIGIRPRGLVIHA